MPACFARTVVINSNSFNVINNRNNVPANDITDYVCQINGTYAFLKTVANGGSVQSATGLDILFATDILGANILKFERVGYNPTTGQVEFHVRIPTLLHTAPYNFYIIFGFGGAVDYSDRQNTWESNYVAVYHFGDGTILDLTDSTSNHNDGTGVNGPTAAAGLVGMGGLLLASASNQYVTVPSAASIDNLGGTQGYVMEATFKLNSGAPALIDRVILSKMNNLSGFMMYQRSSTTPGGDSSVYDTSEPSCGFQSVGSQSGAVGAGYTQSISHEYNDHAGAPIQTSLAFGGGGFGSQRAWQGVVEPATSAGVALWIGNSQSGGANPCHGSGTLGVWDGIIDEIRLRKTSFPDDIVGAAGDAGINRLITQWNNFYDPSHFYTIGGANLNTTFPSAGAGTAIATSKIVGRDLSKKYNYDPFQNLYQRLKTEDPDLFRTFDRIERTFRTAFSAINSVGVTNADGVIAPLGLAQSFPAQANKFIVSFDQSTGLFTARQPTDTDLSLSDVVTNNVSITKHGFAPKAPNDVTKFLNGAGAYTVPAGAGGALVLLEQHTAAVSATLDFTAAISGTYDEYQIEFNNIVPATAGSNIILRFSTDGGVTYDAGANYAWVGQRQSIAGTAGNVGSNATTSFGMDVSGGPTNTASRGGLTVTARLFLSANGTIRPRIIWSGGLDDGTANLVIWVIASGEYLSVTAINALRVLASAGNLTSGVVRVYGVAK